MTLQSLGHLLKDTTKPPHTSIFIHSLSLKTLNINDGMNNSPKGQVGLGRQSPYSKHPLFFLLRHTIYAEHDVSWSGISLWSFWSRLKQAARLKCKATANNVERKLYSAYLHSIKKPFSTPHTTPIFTNNLLDIQKHTSFLSFSLFIHSIIWYLVFVPKSILLC